MKEIVLCGRGRCCARIRKEDDGTYTIEDDYNGKVKLTHNELQILKDVITKGDM